MKPDQEQVCLLLKETVGLLCRNGLTFSTCLRVQGLLGITIDDQHVFIVQMDEILRNDDATSRSDVGTESGTGGFISTCKSTSGVTCSRKRRRKVSTQESDAGNGRVSNQRTHPSDGNLTQTAYNEDVITIGDDDDTKQDPGEYFGQLNFKSETLKPNTGFTYENNFGNETFEELLASESLCSGDQLVQYDAYDNNTVKSENFQDGYPAISRRTVARRGRVYRGQGGRLQPPLKQEHQLLNYPARQIVSKYRQQQQQQWSQQEDAQSLVVTRSLHECGYPGCGKQFLRKQHLLRHQTHKHGRQPTRVLAYTPTWIRPSQEDLLTD